LKESEDEIDVKECYRRRRVRSAANGDPSCGGAWGDSLYLLGLGCGSREGGALINVSGPVLLLFGIGCRWCVCGTDHGMVI
jgi:hypothetical protein